MALFPASGDNYNGYTFKNRTALDLTTAKTLNEDCFILIQGVSSRVSRVTIFDTYGSIDIPANCNLSLFMPKGTVIDAVNSATAPTAVYLLNLTKN